jgi:transcriptional regulator with XRE-family HTH domain
MVMKDLITKLEEFRLENRITQTELADMMGVAFVTVNRWLNGHQYPNRIQEYHIEKLLSSKGRKR